MLINNLKICLVAGVLLFSTGIGHAQKGLKDQPKLPQVVGSYRGSEPCEECRVIAIELDLEYVTDTNGTYTLREKYMGKGKDEVLSSLRRVGQWLVTSDDADKKKVPVLVLDNDLPEKTTYYQVMADGALLPLDADKHAGEDAKNRLMVKVKE